MLIIAERIHASHRYIASAISSENRAFIQNEAKALALAGADYIDVNTEIFGEKEGERLKWVIEAIQEVTDLPLSINSSNPAVIKNVLGFLKKKPIVNSISLKPTRLEGILPLVAEHKAKVIGLCQSGETTAETVEDKMRMAGQLVKRVTGAGISLDDLYIDPLAYPLATNPQSATATIQAIEWIRTGFPGVHTTCGLTAVSYGLPNRRLVDRIFLVAAIFRGLDAAILDPTDRQLYGAFMAARMVSGKDAFCREYIDASQEGRFE